MAESANNLILADRRLTIKNISEQPGRFMGWAQKI